MADEENAERAQGGQRAIRNGRKEMAMYMQNYLQMTPPTTHLSTKES